MPILRFRISGRARALGDCLARLLGELDRATRRLLIEEGRVRIDGETVDRRAEVCPAGALIEIDVADARDVEWLSRDLPSGSHEGWTAWVDLPPWAAGELDLPEGIVAFRVVEQRGGLARLSLTGAACEASEICEALAAAEMPVVGDLERAGLGLAGGAWLRTGDAGGADLPVAELDEPPWLDAGADPGAEEAPAFRVSDETARAISRGHPWILADAASDSAGRFAPGTLVSVEDRQGQRLAWAHIERERRIAARVWATGAETLRAAPSVEARVARALGRRRGLLVDGRSTGTTAFRLIHGEGDAFPGLFVDRLGPLLRVLVTGRMPEALRARMIAALRAQLPVSPEGEPWSVLELLHLRAPERGRFDRVRWLEGGLAALRDCALEVDDRGFFVWERGLRFGVDPGWDSPRRTRPGYGLFVDQRDNRERLARSAAQGGRWLNLFAHTGAFSVSLLAAGASHVESVDLSAGYLARLEENLRANREQGVDLGRHRSVKGDGRRHLEGLASGIRFDGIVLDPPTAAAAGRRFWSVRRDLEPLLRLCVAHLTPGGVLLVTQNRSGAPLGLDRILERIAGRAHRGIQRLEPAPAGLDHPARSGFPEGDPFEGCLLALE